MNITNCRSSVAFFIYCGAAVLVVVNGQPTTDDDMHKVEISKLIDLVAEFKAELTKMKGELVSNIMSLNKLIG